MICISYRYRSDFFNICGFWNKEKDYEWLCLWLFVLFGSYSINSCYEWNSLHKKSCPYFLNIWKTDLTFFFFSYQKPFFFFFIIIKQIWSFTNQKPIFSSSQKQIWYFFKSKDFILCNKHRSEFLSTKTIFSTYYKTDLVIFNKPKSIFFNHQNISEFF